MPTIRNRPADSLQHAVAAYVTAIAIPTFDEHAIAARRGSHPIAHAPRRSLLPLATFATAAALALFLAFNASAVVAGMERVFAAWTVVGGRTIPMNVREVDLAKARADVPFDIIVPPVLPGSTVTLREALSSASPSNDSVAFDVNLGRSHPEISIVESRSLGPHQFFVELQGPERDGTKIAPPPHPPKLSGFTKPEIAVMAKLGKDAFVPLTWVTHGTRIVLVSPPGALSPAQVRAIRSAMSH